jgi:hypothetical protein
MVNSDKSSKQSEVIINNSDVTDVKKKKPLVIKAFHGTTAPSFDVFAPNIRKKEQLGFGIHFAQNLDFAKLYANDDLVARKGKFPRVITAEITLSYPLHANQIVKDGTCEFELAVKLAGKKLFTSKDEDGIKCAYMQNAIDSTTQERAQMLIVAAGFDSVVYEARVGTQGVGAHIRLRSEAYIVFNPENIKIISVQDLTIPKDETKKKTEAMKNGAIQSKNYLTNQMEEVEIVKNKLSP